MLITDNRLNRSLISISPPLSRNRSSCLVVSRKGMDAGNQLCTILSISFRTFLDMKGDAIQRFNVPGRFYGQLYDAQYSLTSDNVNGLLLTGDFSSFDGKRMNNIVMLKVDLAENTNNEP